MTSDERALADAATELVQAMASWTPQRVAEGMGLWLRVIGIFDKTPIDRHQRLATKLLHRIPEIREFTKVT